MNTKEVKKIGQALTLHRNHSLQLLNKFKVQSGKITMNNLDTVIEINTDLQGEYISDFIQFAKNLNIEYSKDPLFKIEDFPCSPEIIDKQPINPALLQKSFKPFLKYASKDEERAILMNVNFPRNYGAWATDGYRLTIDHSIVSDFPFSLKPETVNIIDILLSAGETIRNVQLCNKIADIHELTEQEKQRIENRKNRLNFLIQYIDESGYISSKMKEQRSYFKNMLYTLPSPDRIDYEVNHKYILIETDNVKMISKMGDGQLPDVRKVLPDMKEQKIAHFTETDIQVLKSAVDSVGIYSNEKTKMIFARCNIIFVRNRDTEKQFKIELPFIFAPVDFYIGFNSVYLSELLSDITSGCNIGMKTEISAVYFRCENQPDHLIMPLRIINDTEDQPVNENEFISLSLPEIKAKKATVETTEKHYLVDCDGFYAITTVGTMPGIVKKLSDTEFKTLKKIGIVPIDEQVAA